MNRKLPPAWAMLRLAWRSRWPLARYFLCFPTSARMVMPPCVPRCSTSAANGARARNTLAVIASCPGNGSRALGVTSLGLPWRLRLLRF